MSTPPAVGDDTLAILIRDRCSTSHIGAEDAVLTNAFRDGWASIRRQGAVAYVCGRCMDVAEAIVARCRGAGR